MTEKKELKKAVEMPKRDHRKWVIKDEITGMYLVNFAYQFNPNAYVDVTKTEKEVAYTPPKSKVLKDKPTRWTRNLKDASKFGTIIADRLCESMNSHKKYVAKKILHQI